MLHLLFITSLMLQMLWYFYIEPIWKSYLFASKLRTCLVSVFENCFLLSKTRRTRKIGRTYLVFSFFFVMKNTESTETLNSEDKNSFQRTSKWCSLCFQKQEPNRPLIFIMLFWFIMRSSFLLINRRIVFRLVISVRSICFQLVPFFYQMVKGFFFVSLSVLSASAEERKGSKCPDCH